MRLPFLSSLLWLTALLAAQTQAPTPEAPTPDDPPKTSRAPTPEQVTERLNQVKRDLLPKVWPPKIDGNELETKKYFAKWQAVISPHYILFTNGPSTSCKKYATTLEDLYSYVQKELPFDDVDHLLTCYIFATPDEYYRFCGVAAGWTEKEAKATAGHANATYYACYYDSPRAPVVFHEATHQIIGACHKVSGVGSWFQEGLAVWFEKKTAGEKPAGTIKNDFKRGDCYPLVELCALPSLLSDPKGNGRRNYAQAGALLDFLMTTKLPPVAGKLPEFLAAARKGRGFGRGLDTSKDLVKQVYGLTLPELEALWKEHVGAR